MKRALVVGLNHYQTQKSLRGCVNDADDVTLLLRQTFAFDEVNLLPETAVTKAVLLEALQALFRPGSDEAEGVRVFFFAGHGGRVFDLNDEEVDRIDENLCLPDYDSTNPATYLLDDEFAALLQSAQALAPQLTRIIILDSCHSGTATRDVEASLDWRTVTLRLQKAYHIASPESLGWPINDPRLTLACIGRTAEDPPALAAALEKTVPTTITVHPFGRTGTDEPESHLLFSGCSAAQTCKDVPLGGRYRGAFTHTFCQIARQNPQITWQALREQTRQVIEGPFAQSPQLEGPAAIKLLPLFQ